MEPVELFSYIISFSQKRPESWKLKYTRCYKPKMKPDMETGLQKTIFLV